MKAGRIKLIDQTLLPGQVEYVYCGTVDKLAESIRTLKVRGAPGYWRCCGLWPLSGGH